MPKVCPVCDTVYSDANAFCPTDGTTLHVVDVDGGLVGSVIADRYLVTDLLGEGGMGKVYLARHVRLPQQAAIKVLRRDMVQDPAAVARFNREASNASRIDDEHVARVYDFGEASGGTVYLAMEYVPGKTLKEVVAKAGALEPRRAVDVVNQIAMGLDAAHRLKIIHRDLKPDNILVVEGTDGPDRVKVVDFGIAKAFGAADGNLTKTGFVVGTPEFMSPEQLMGAPLDARSDVYALGLVAFQCFTAALPFAGDSADQVMTARLTSPPRSLQEATGTTWPTALQEAFDAALARDVTARPESAGAFARMVTAAMEGWAPGGATPSAKVALPTVGESKGLKTQSAKGSTLVLPATPDRSNRLPFIAVAVLVLSVGGYFAYRSNQRPDAVPPTTSELATGSANPAGDTTAPVTPTQVGAQTPPAVDPNAIAAAVRDSMARETAARAQGDSAGPLASSQKSSAAGGRTPVTPPAGTSGKAAAPEPKAAAEEPKVAPPVAPPAPVESPALSDSLAALSKSLGAGADRATSGRIASALRELAPQLKVPWLRARAYNFLLKADAKGGDSEALNRDSPRACEAFKQAMSGARDESQLAQLRKYREDNGCP